MYRYYKHFLFIFLMMLLWIPLLQQQYHFFDEKPLGGFYQNPSKPDFNKSSWFSGIYAEQYNKFFNYNVGFKAMLIRCRNQFYYSVLSSSGETDYVVGKNKNIFHINNVRSVIGDDFKGEQFIKDRIKKLQLVSDSLAARGIPLFVVIAPGKANLYRDDLPQKFSPADSTQTNYYWLSKYIDQTNIPLLDLHKYYLQIKDTTRQPLFTLGSMHWSTYHLTHSYDSILSFIQSLQGTPVTGFYIGATVESDSVSDQEMDQLENMNIFTTLKKEKYFYPGWSVVDTPNVKTKILVISDSFFLSFSGKGLTNNTLDYECWFYNHEVYPQSYTKPTTVNEIDYWADIFKQDYICVLMSEVSWGEAGFDFVDNCYEYFTLGDQASFHIAFNEVMNKVEVNYKYISTTPSYIDLETDKAKEQKRTLDEMMYVDAIYLTNVEYAQKLGSDTIGSAIAELLSKSALVDELLKKQKTSHAIKFKENIVQALSKYLVLKKTDYNKLSEELSQISTSH